MKHIHDSDHLQERRLEFGSQCSLKLNPILDSGLSFETSAKDESIEPSESSWHPFRGSMFHVRKGPNYDKSKQKAPSDESLYQPVHCFAFRSERRTSLIDSLPVPHDIAFPGGNIPDLLDERVPHLFVVQYQIPTEQPKLMKSSHDGKGGQIALYFVPSKRFCLESNALFQNDQNSNLQCSNAAKLFTEWCGQCDVSKTWKSRFKCIAKVRHVDSDSGSFLNRFNGKPMLVKETSSARRYVTNEGIRIIEYTVNSKLECMLLFILFHCRYR